MDSPILQSKRRGADTCDCDKTTTDPVMFACFAASLLMVAVHLNTSAAAHIPTTTNDNSAAFYSAEA